MSTKSIHSFGIGKSYATVENAEKQFKKLENISWNGKEMHFRTLVSAVKVEGKTRFIPVVVLNNDQQFMVGGIAHSGITVTF